MFLLSKKLFFYVLLAFSSSFVSANEMQKSTSVDIFKVGAPQEEAITLNYPAKTLSSQTTTLKARANGLLLEKKFMEGDFVKKGDVLYKIEPESYIAAQKLAKANVASLDIQVQKTSKEWSRVKSLFDKGASSEQDRDTAYWAYESAKSALESAKASLDIAVINLDRTTIKAPMSGITGAKLIDVSALVSEGTALVEITQIDPLHVEFSIPNIDLIKEKYNIKNGKWSNPTDGKLKATLTVGKLNYKEIGVVDFIDNTINAKTGSLRARATFKNSTKELLPNQFVTISLTGLVRNNVVQIPQKALVQNPLGTNVYIIEDDKAVLKNVVVGEISNGNAIIESGLKEGDKLIVNNLLKIKQNAPVKIDKIINQEGK
ncbi:efflux RND transporter periplasmic adaptor subunit [Sulfurospirillum diekertiae]|uniref:Multidrug resistance protein MdtE n=1 Tax=Sulfurospirillum diekertiae TaxID=1854492 RepID=A0A1Y0HLJ3_9BACT|nr:efflux RND transporter periplasmic adaptor subunit [Sulfurospirillum diekertiae]ARU48215.1 Multidrug resistance protein MdtE [Sulfurospirillum diekertiae]ASC93058.1 Multidrug resistance protein MdtE [Sulfurospirillum diekertiae]